MKKYLSISAWLFLTVSCFGMDGEHQLPDGLEEELAFFGALAAGKLHVHDGKIFFNGYANMNFGKRCTQFSKTPAEVKDIFVLGLEYKDTCEKLGRCTVAPHNEYGDYLFRAFVSFMNNQDIPTSQNAIYDTQSEDAWNVNLWPEMRPELRKEFSKKSAEQKDSIISQLAKQIKENRAAVVRAINEKNAADLQKALAQPLHLTTRSLAEIIFKARHGQELLPADTQ